MPRVRVFFILAGALTHYRTECGIVFPRLEPLAALVLDGGLHIGIERDEPMQGTTIPTLLSRAAKAYNQFDPLSQHMNYDGLQASYWQSQIARVGALRDKIAASVAPQPGRVIPDDEDLAIGQGRRLKMAVLFLDISGFSQRLSETEDEQAMLLKVLNLFFTEMIKIAEEYGGTVEKNTGDGLMAYFEDGAGTPAGSGSKRAVACALSMMAANAHLIKPILEATPVPEIKFRVSIDYGTVTIARLGAARRFNANVAIGATANFACKMLSLAQPGEIVIGAAVRDELPLEWHQFTQYMPVATGWTYRLTGLPYPLYIYTGRWNRLT